MQLWDRLAPPLLTQPRPSPVWAFETQAGKMSYKKCQLGGHLTFSFNVVLSQAGLPATKTDRKSFSLGKGGRRALSDGIALLPLDRLS